MLLFALISLCTGIDSYDPGVRSDYVETLRDGGRNFMGGRLAAGGGVGVRVRSGITG